MALAKIIVLTVLGLNLLAILFSSININLQKRSTTEVPELEDAQIQELYETEATSSYRFDDPIKAYFLLEKLDIFEEVPEGLIRKANYSNFASGLKINNNYCQEHRAYFIEHPEILFEQTNILTNYYRKHKLRTDVIPSIGANNVQPEVFTNSKSPLMEFKYNMRLDATLFIMQNLFFYKRQIGKQFSCLSQASNHIPGHDRMYRKDYAGQAAVDYAKKYLSKPSCFNFNKYFIKTWILSQEDQCKNFFEEFLSPKYQKLKEERNVVYFRKIGANAHEGKGVFPVNDQEEDYIQNLYANGTLCGKVKDNNLIQYNVHNLLLVNNRKFGFRMFMLVASTNPLLVYYHDGYARLSLNEYDSKSKEISTFVTNIGVNLKEAEKGTGLTEEQIQESTLWFLADFQRYMLENGLTTDPNWLENYLRPELKKVMVHLIRMAQERFVKRSSVYELYGLDFVMDEDLKLWFIEANTMPLVDGFTTRSTKMLNKMLVDSIEIELGLVRSRMKRVIEYVNMLSQETSVGSFISNLESKRKKFRELTKNYFEPEFEPSSGNGFQKIVDEREYGTQRYANLIDKGCL